MKKSILLVAAIFSIAVMFTSCKETKKDEVKEEMHEGHDHDAKEAVAGEFQCPMDCEKGKKYAEAGSCPVCKMDLKNQSANKSGVHAEGCTCKAGGECKCEAGKCKCQTEDSEKTACTKCEPGKCTCKVAKECTKCEPGKCTCKKETALKTECKKSSCKAGGCKSKA